MRFAAPRTCLALAIVLTGTAAAHAEVPMVQIGGKLVVTTDAAGGTLRIEGTTTLGEVLVIAGPTTMQAFVGVRDIVVHGQSGDDAIEVAALQIGGSLSAKLGAGNDAVSIHPFGWFAPMPVVLGGKLDVRLGGQSGDSFQAFGSAPFGITIQGNVTIKGAASVKFSGAGSAFMIEPGDCVIGGNLRIDRASAKSSTTTPAQVFLTDLNVGGSTKVKLGATSDDVTIIDSTFAGKFFLALGAGDDTCDFGQQDTCFDAPGIIDAGPGNDQIAGTFSLVFAVEPSFQAFEFKS